MNIFLKISNKFRRNNKSGELVIRQIGTSATGSFHAFPSKKPCVFCDSETSSENAKAFDGTDR